MPRLPINWDVLSDAQRSVIINQLNDSVSYLSPIINQNDLGAVQPASHFRRDGLIAYADGSDWNPSSLGKGFYRHEITGATGTWTAMEYTHPSDFSDLNHTHENATQGGIVDASNADTVDGAHASTTPATSTIPIAKTSGQPLLNKDWLPTVAIFHDQKAQNTAGGGATAATWHTRDLNTTICNDITGCSLNTGTGIITLPSGTYNVIASVPAYKVNEHQGVLYNNSDSSNILIGSSEVSGAVSNVTSRSLICGCFTIAAEKDVKLYHYITTARATDGLGLDVNITTEVYSMIKLTKIA